MDSVLVFPPGASQLASAWASTIQLGSWLMADPGPDYGARGLIESVEAQNALRDGGTFAYRRGVIRKMALPLMLNTPSPAGWETALRKAVTPGAIVAVQPEGVPSAQAVYFDIIDGRWEPDYNIFHNRVGVRKGTLYLDTQPWGYWPTEILLASAASIGFLGQLPVNGASVIGDVPPLAHVAVAPTCASQYTAGTWQSDMVAVSLSGRPSFAPFLPPAMFIATGLGPLGNALPSLIGDKYAPASQALRHYAATLTVGTNGNVLWTPALSASAIPSALEPAYRGRFRAFMFYRLSPSQPIPMLSLLDAERTSASYAPQTLTTPMAYGNQLATVYSQTSDGVSPSPGYSMLDMGEITLPGVGSGVQGSERLRLFMQTGPAPTQTLNIASWAFWFGGVYLFPVDGAAGILTRGAVVPSICTGFGQASQGAVEFNPNFVEGAVNIAVTPPLALGVPAPPLGDGKGYYRGVPLRIGASVVSLALLTGDRLTLDGHGGATYAVAQANFEYAQVSVSYRPTFQFLAGG